MHTKDDASSRPQGGPRTIVDLCLAAISLLFFASSAFAATHIRTVGASGCDHGDLQPAIDSMAALPSTDTKILRIAYDKQYTNVAVTITDQSLTLSGGYANCASDTQTIIDSNLLGTGSAPVIEVISTGAAQELVLDSLRVSLGGGGGEGGGLRADGPVAVRVRNVDFFNNSSELGGAVALLNGAGLEMEEVAMSGNTAKTGGALYCQAGAVTGLGQNIFEGNVATSLGGALSLDQCATTLEGAHTFSQNSADSGGAIVSISDLLILSGARGRTRFIGNRAGDNISFQYGGAIYHASGELLVQDALFENNRVSSGGALSCGGAVASTSPDSHVRIESTSLACDGETCSVFKDNRADRGAAVCMARGSLELLNTKVSGHTDFDGLPTASVIDLGFLNQATAWIEGSQIVDNSAVSLIRQRESEDLTIVYSTFAGNRNVDTVLALFNPGTLTAPEVKSTSHEIRLLSTIFWEFPETNILSGGLPTTTECLLLSETQTVPLPAYWLDDDPRFISPASDDYRLDASSPAIDFCPPSSRATDRDIDHGPRGVDDPDTPNASAGRLFDIGSDEFNSNGSVFENGFESGDLSAWDGSIG